MKITTLTGCIVFLTFGYSFSQFTVIATNTVEDLYEIDVFNGEAFVVGNHNYIAKLDDPNNQTVLKQAPGPDTNVIHSFNRVDANTVFIASSYPLFGEDSHFIYRSDDNCETWDLLFDTINLRINKLLMFDSLEGIFVNSNYKQFRTINGGLAWNLENNSLFDVSALEKYGDSIVCMGMFENFAYSTDRGRTWGFNPFYQYNPTSYAFLNEDSLLAICGNVVTSTESRGANWGVVNLADTAFLVDIKYHSGKVYSVGKLSYYDNFGEEIIHGVIAGSLDSGQTWQYYDTDLDTWFKSMEFLNDSIALICGTNGVLIKYNYRDHVLGQKEVKFEAISKQITPNPAENKITFERRPGNEREPIIILDRAGRKVFEISATPESIITIDIGSLSPGLYILKCGSAEKKWIKK
ncbi:MAG: T9SS type A sorting domain-containing protein [Bacteroidota bacterium]